MKRSEGKKISKREFLKQGLFGVGGLVCGVHCQGSQKSENEISASVINYIFSDKQSKHTKEALFYSLTPKGVKCLICPNECTIKVNETGDCRNRLHTNDKLYSTAYGNPCAIHIDPIEKKPLSHFYPESRAYSIATAGCNLACMNCQNWTISQKSPRETRNVDLMPERVVEEALKNNCKSIAYTYSEPITFYEYTLDTAKIARTEGIKNVMVSAGYINEDPLRKLCKYIDAANIDLKSFSEDIYLRLSAGKLQPILDGLKIFKEEGVWLEITNLVVPTWTDDFDMIKNMCEWLVKNGFEDNPLHFSRFHPLYKLTQLPQTPLSTLVKAREIALNEGVKYVYIGNVPGTGAENTYCPNCSKTLIERRGYRIMQNHIKNNNCEFCKNEIAGIWA